MEYFIFGVVIIIGWIIGFFLLDKLVNWLICRFTWEFRTIDLYGQIIEDKKETEKVDESSKV